MLSLYFAPCAVYTSDQAVVQITINVLYSVWADG